MELGDFQTAVTDLEYVVVSERKYDSYRAAALLAHAYTNTDQSDLAEAWFLEVTEISTISETLFNYALFLKRQKRYGEAREWAEKILSKQKTLPRYLKRRERPWVQKASVLLKEVRSL
jgi:Tfp pilus assembly protein PilF